MSELTGGALALLHRLEAAPPGPAHQKKESKEYRAHHPEIRPILTTPVTLLGRTGDHRHHGPEGAEALRHHLDCLV